MKYIVCTSDNKKCQAQIDFLRYTYLKHFNRTEDFIVIYDSNKNIDKYPPFVKLSLVKAINNLDDKQLICLMDPDTIFLNDHICKESFDADKFYAIFREKNGVVPICPWRKNQNDLREPIMTFSEELDNWQQLMSLMNVIGNLMIDSSTIKYCQTAVVIGSVKIWKKVLEKWDQHLIRLIYDKSLHELFPFIETNWLKEQVAFSLAVLDSNVECAKLQPKYNYQNYEKWEAKMKWSDDVSIIHYPWGGELNKSQLDLLLSKEMSLKSNQIIKSIFHEFVRSCK